MEITEILSKVDHTLLAQGATWEEIRQILAEVPPARSISDTLQIAGLDYREFEELYSEEKINDSVWFAKDLKDRYTVLWVYYSLFYRE